MTWRVASPPSLVKTPVIGSLVVIRSSGSLSYPRHSILLASAHKLTDERLHLRLCDDLAVWRMRKHAPRRIDFVSPDLDLRIHNRQARYLHTREQLRILCNRLFRLVKQRVVHLHHLRRQIGILRVFRAAEDVQLEAAAQQRFTHLVDVLTNVRPGLAVIAVQIFIHNGAVIRIRVPHQFADEIGPQPGHLTTGLTVRLHEERIDVVVRIELDVGFQGMKVRKWTDEVGELDVVIPDKNVA